MASKHKITAYTSDTRLYEWATGEAEKKGVKRSAYLESLMRDEMQRQMAEIGDTSSRLKAQFTIFKTFTPQEQILSAYTGVNCGVNCDVNFDVDAELRANVLMQLASNPQERVKDFHSWLEKKSICLSMLTLMQTF